jgi:GT2 family glycosyltransferase
MHRSVYDQVGGWDTSFFLDHEDIDLFIRVWQRGWECVSVPEAKVYHAVGVSSGKTLNNGQRVAPRRYISGRSNLAVIALKYYSGWALSLAGASLFVPLAGDVIRLRWQKLWLDLRAVALTYKRMGAIRRFRRANKTWSKVKPGLQFFLQKDMTHP